MKFGYTEEEYARFRNHAWRSLVLFPILHYFIYCTSLNLSNAGTVMWSELNWSKVYLGVLAGVLFWTYVGGHLVNGRPEKRIPVVVLSAIVGGLTIGVFCLLDPIVTWQVWLIRALLFIAGFCIYVVNGTAWVCATDVGGRVLSGTSAVVLYFRGYIVVAVQALVYGFLVDKIGWGAVFVSLAVLCTTMVFFELYGHAQKGKMQSILKCGVLK